MLERAAIIAGLVEQLAPQPRFRAAWIGGSDAHGRADELSDVDIFLVVEAGEIEAAVEAFDAAVRTLSPIRLRYRLPMPTFHGFHQAFYQLEDAPEHRMVDWLMIERGQAHPWLEVERHGTPRMLFDKDGDVVAQHVNREQIAITVASKVEDLRVRFAMLSHLPAKLVQRGMPVDAVHFYHSLVLRPLVDLLRAVHCPDRHDYGFRYVEEDLPADAFASLRSLAFIARGTDIPARVAAAEALFRRTLAEWDARGGRVDNASDGAGGDG